MDSTKQGKIYGPEPLPKPSRSYESINDVVNLKKSNLEKIYSKRLEKRPDIEGQVKIRFRIDESGKVIYSKIIESNIDDSIFQKQLLNEVNSWIFPKIDKPGDMIEIIYPFNFKKGFSFAALAVVISLFSLVITMLFISQNIK
jgi:TonB family protein